jgi:hypothetical protein
MPILGFRVGNIAYCTDVSAIPETTFDLLRDLDVLVLDALQWKKHVTHFSVDEAVEAAKRIGAKQTFFTHIAHALPHEATNQKLPPNMRLAFDGERVLSPLPPGEGLGEGVFQFRVARVTNTPSPPPFHLAISANDEGRGSQKQKAPCPVITPSPNTTTRNMSVAISSRWMCRSS